MRLGLNNLTKKRRPTYAWIIPVEVVMVVVVFFVFVGVVHAEWIEPSLSPPGVLQPLYAPLTAGPENQAKEGYLELWPDYGLTQSSSLTFNPTKPLDIKGLGAKLSTPYVFNDILTVDNGTLFAHGPHGWVGIGTTVGTDNVKLKVDSVAKTGAAVQVGSDTAPVDGRAVSAYSSNGAGLTASTGEGAQSSGVYGYRESDNGSAVSGTSIMANGIKGTSTSGKGIEAANESLTSAAVYARNNSSGWAGYFKGFLGAGSDVVAPQFLPRGLNNSLMPFISGQEVAAYSNFGTWTESSSFVRLAYDGTYLWALTRRNSAADNKNLFKFRASDGTLIHSYTITDTVYGVLALTFDGKYLWVITYSGDAVRFNPEDGSTNLINLLPSANYSSVAVSTEAGQSYLWVTVDDGSGVYDGVYKVNTSTLAFTLYSFHSDANSAVNLNLAGVDNPYSNAMVYDGQYMWIVVTSGHLVRLWGQDPSDAAHPAVAYSTNGAYRALVYDGQYLWLGTSGPTALPILRVWATDPNDAAHPMNLVYPPAGQALPGYLKSMVFDGTYVWAMNHSNPILYRYLAADPTQRIVITTSVAGGTEDILFDGTHVWISQSGAPPTLHKIFSGTGYGQTNLSRVVSLDAIAAQSGNFNVGGNGQVGANMTAGGDVDVSGNQWGGSPETVSLNVDSVPGTCPTDGTFVTGVTLDANSRLDTITCQGL